MKSLPETDILKLYLREIGGYDLLTKDEEIELSSRSLSGDEDARQKLISHNLKLVVKISKAYQGRGIPLIDLIQEGSIGLHNAAVRYDYRRGTRFSTYASPWIKQAVKRAIYDKSQAIRVPVNVASKLGEMRILHASGMTYKEISDMFSFSEKTTKGALESSVKSLDDELGGGEGTHLFDFIASEDYGVKDFEKRDISSYITNTVKQILAGRITSRNYEITSYAFQLDGQPKMNLREIGEMYDITRERTRQIVKKSIKILKKHDGIKELEDLVGAVD